MNLLTKTVYYIIVLVSGVVILVSMLSLTSDNSLWWMKVLDFPRIQCLIISLLCLLLFAILNRRWSFWPVFLCLGLVSTIVVQSTFIFPYTPLSRPVVATLDASEADPSAQIGLMIANVYMYNREDSALMAIVERRNPDMLLLLETNQWWMDHLPDLRQQYPHYHEHPLDDTYGMALYSRYPLDNFTTMFLQHDNVPSFHCDVVLPNGHSFRFHGMHPVPPVLSDHPDNEGEREVELIKVGRLVKEHNASTVVAGDFNDVAWSNTSRLFQISGGLLDTRVGRGLYNSFDAKSYLMRWPLDHVYVSDDFQVVEFQRLDKFGSDHFPIYVKLALMH